MHFVTRPGLTPPKLDVVTSKAGSAPGDIFLTPTGGGAAQPELLIVDNNGDPVWIAPRTTTRALGLSVQHYRGEPVLTWYEGSVFRPGVGQGTYVIADQSYHEIARVHAVNGYAADLHDMTITPQGTALFTIYNPVVVDASSVGGAKKQHTLEAVVQEVDIATGSLLFEWHSLASIGLGESYQPVTKEVGGYYDYLHVNSVALDRDGNLLVSGRHTSTVYKIDRLAGILDWRLGGKLDNFTMARRSEPAFQHDARVDRQGKLTIFDNGASNAVTSHATRGLVLRVDEQAMTAVLDHAYSPPVRLHAKSQGSFRLLANGDYFAGWGDQPEYTEFAPDGQVVYDVRFPTAEGAIISYRALRLPWTGRPTDPPAVVAKRAGDDATTVSVSWNGATEVATWALLAGPDADHLTRVTTAAKHGFETTIHLTTNQPYLAVQALDSGGTVLATSPPTTPTS